MKDYLPTENLLADWLPIFSADFNILPSLLQESFNIQVPVDIQKPFVMEDHTPNFFELYFQCRKLKRMFVLEIIYPWQLWALSDEYFAQKALLVSDFDSLNLSPSHYVVFRGHEKLILNHLQGSLGGRYLQMAALSGNVNLIRAFGKLTNELQTMDSRGRTCLHYAAASGNPHALQEVITMGKDIPHFHEQKDYSQRTIMHYAALSGDPVLMQWTLEKYPQLIYTPATCDINFFHVALKSGSASLIDFLLKYNGEDVLKKIEPQRFLGRFSLKFNRNASPEKYSLKKIKTLKTTSGKNIAHYAAGSHNPAILRKILKVGADLKLSRDNYGATLLHVAAYSGSPRMIDYVWEKIPEIRQWQSKEGANIIHFAAQSGHIDAFKRCLELEPDLLLTRDMHGRSVLECAEKSKSIIFLRWLIVEHTLVLGFFLWPIAKEGGKDYPFFFKSLYSVFADAVQFIYEFKATLKWIELLFIHFKEELAHYLVSDQLKLPPQIILQLLEEKWFSFQKMNEESYTILACILRMKIIPTKDVPLSKSLILRLIQCIQLNAAIDSELIWTLQHLLLNISLSKEDAFQEEEVTALWVILQDYLRDNADDVYRSININLVRSLLVTSTLSCMYPKPNPALLEISPANFGEHLTYIEGVGREKKDLNKAVRECLEYIIFPGLRFILENRTHIIKHFLEKHSLFWLASTLPIHLENIPHGQVENLERLLDRILENFIAAFYIAQKVGELYSFFSQLEVGLCIEGRVDKVFTWAATYSECEGVDTILVKADRHYRAFAKYLEGKLGNEIEDFQAASQFIKTRYLGYKCQRHAQYAPDGQLTAQGIDDYLRNVLCYDAEIKASLPIIKKIDIHIKQVRHPAEKAAFTHLRLQINMALRDQQANAAIPLDMILTTWKWADSLIPGKKNADLINDILHGYSFFAEKSKGIRFLKQLLGCDQNDSSENVPSMPL